uniref:Dialkylrecorsinol condensing enzyme n=1 Tax=Candidatus Kentrum sp. DK TaxID=2126562 RepID=A0A450T245_9GAMM|nr:MAG: hypothetical protein BECKDK2373C_GA0170839_10833 [Candidatus Kentron sp. DK]
MDATQIKKKKILVIYFSQTGQLYNILQSFTSPLQGKSFINVDFLEIQPKNKFPFPWRPVDFFDVFPESVYEEPCGICSISDSISNSEYDLIILGYQVWYLSPSIPVMSFLKTKDAERLLRGKPVITVIACRNMWLQAQESMKRHLLRLKANHIDNVTLVDNNPFPLNMLSILIWMLLGKKGPSLNGKIPESGISGKDTGDCRRFGKAVLDAILNEKMFCRPVLKGLGAANVNEKFILIEEIGYKSFKIWGALLRGSGRVSPGLRKLALILYFVFLMIMVFTAVPILLVVQIILRPILGKKLKAKRDYYALPSGE